jgi:hypothetical protein
VSLPRKYGFTDQLADSHNVADIKRPPSDAYTSINPVNVAKPIANSLSMTNKPTIPARSTICLSKKLIGELS